jgi:hypothetical protein
MPAVPLDVVLERCAAALLQPVDTAGGSVVIVVTSSEPPAVALLTGASVRLRGSSLQLAVFTASSMARLPASTFTLITTHQGAGLRLQGRIVQRRSSAHVTLIECEVTAADVLQEAPWTTSFTFTTAAPEETGPLLAYWAGLRSWLADDASGPPPDVPRMGASS